LARAAAAAALGLLVSACAVSKPSSISTGALPDPEAKTASTEAPAPIPQSAAKTNKAKVALLLPLSAPGHAGLIANSLKKSAELALHGPGSADVDLIVRDDRGTPDGARLAAREAVDAGAEIIIGPLFSKSVTAAAPIAHQANLPMLAFSNDEQVAGNGVYLVSFLNRPEVEKPLHATAAPCAPSKLTGSARPANSRRSAVSSSK
jgi:ABC-type branched-subunit amino acid transport system substrate-binding protein